MKKFIWNCCIKLKEKEILNKDFNTLKEIAKTLNMTYAQVSEKTPNGRNKRRIYNNDYIPDIFIIKKEAI